MFSSFQSSDDKQISETTAYDFSFTTLKGDKPLALKDFKNKVILIVNTASHCGFTSQYEGLQKLYTIYKDQGLIVIGVPCNDFGGQEPGNEQEIDNFCKIKYSVTFPMTSKECISGDNAHPFYLWAKKVLGFGTAPKWNFHKYLINRKGQLVDYFHSTTSPDSHRLKNTIDKLLAES